MASNPQPFPLEKKSKLPAQFDLKKIPDRWQDSWEMFRDAITLLFGKVKNLEALAKVTAFLSDTKCCLRYLEIVDVKLCQLYVRQGGPAPRHRLSECIIQMANAGGFSQMQGVVLTGDAGLAFGQITGNRILFKDGLSKIHGEFTHSLQWLAVIEAAGELGIGTDIAALYAEAGTTSTLKEYYLTGEKSGGKGPRFHKSGLFDFVCDAFLFQDDGSDSDQTFLLHNLFTKSARSPAFISKLIEQGSLPFLFSYYYGEFGKYNDPRRNNLQGHRQTQAVAKAPAIRQIGTDHAYAPVAFYDLKDPFKPGKVIGERFDPHYLRKK